MNMDLFEENLKKRIVPFRSKEVWLIVYIRKKIRKITKENYVGQTNKDLATYGDAIIKLCILDL